jgi:hypothetical protein
MEIEVARHQQCRPKAGYITTAGAIQSDDHASDDRAGEPNRNLIPTKRFSHTAKKSALAT